MPVLAFLVLNFLAAQAAPVAEPRFANAFGARLLDATAAAGSQPQNRLVSPIANYLAWSMVLNGARGPTLIKLTETLGLAPDALAVGRINDSNRACLAALVSHPAEKSYLPKLTIDNGAWVSNREHGGRPFEFRQGYASALKEHYGADVVPLDFTAPAAAPEINAWFDHKTNGLIPTVVAADEIANLMFLLANATYFEGSWQKPMNEVPAGGYEGGHRAKETRFTLADGRVEPRTMLWATSRYRYARDENEEVVELPFRNADPARQEFVFLAALPAPGRDLSDYRSETSWRRVSTKLAEAERVEGTVWLPKFAFDYEYEARARSPLAVALGLDHVFEDTADLSGMTTIRSTSAKVGLFKSVNRIEVDKKGVKAAAAVVIGGIELASFPQPEFDMHLNRPFAFAIVEKASRALVFLGELQDPK